MQLDYWLTGYGIASPSLMSTGVCILPRLSTTLALASLSDGFLMGGFSTSAEFLRLECEFPMTIISTP